MSNYDLIPLSEDNLRHLDTLYKNVYGKKRSPGYYMSKYSTLYTGVQYVGFIALSGSEPVAYYGVIPVRCSIGGETVLGAQSCDTMTHPDHRKKGLFIALAIRTFELAKKQNIHFVFGFPNQNSYPGFIKKLGFLHQETLECYTLKFRNTLYKKLYRKIFIKMLSKKRESISNFVIDLGFDGVIYDPAYMNYKRYTSNFSLHASDYSAWLNFSNGAMIGAIWPLQKENVTDLIQKIKREFKYASVTFMISPGTELSLILKNRTKQEGFAVILKNLSMEYNLTNLKFQFADIDLF